jgi:hypothetical protein
MLQQENKRLRWELQTCKKLLQVGARAGAAVAPGSAAQIASGLIAIGSFAALVSC